MPRTALRTLTTTTTSLVLLVLTALPALAASAGTKPDPEADPYLIGSLPELLPAAIVGLVLAVVVFAVRPSQDAVVEDDEH